MNIETNSIVKITPSIILLYKNLSYDTLIMYILKYILKYVLKF